MKSYTAKDVVVTVNGNPVLGTWNHTVDTREPDYKMISSPKDVPENGIVYQNDCGFWYEWDLSGKCEDELESLFQTNLIYVKVGE